MLKIKLARFGKKKQPRYRVVITEANSKRDSGYTAEIGEYSPTLTPKVLKLDLKSYESWIKKGAKPTETVAGLAKRVRSGKPFAAKKAKLSKKAMAKLKTKTEAKTQKTEEKPPATDQKEVVAKVEKTVEEAKPAK